MIPFLKKNKDGRKPPKSTVPRTAQESIPFQRMFEDGTCRVRPGYYTRTIQYQDINYEPYYFAFIIPIFFSLSTTTKGLCSKSCLEADFLKLCDAVTVKPLVTRYTTHKNTAAEYICGCVLCSVAHCCVDWIWRDNISPDLTWVILSAITLAVCLADMSASPLRSYPA